MSDRQREALGGSDMSESKRPQGDREGRVYGSFICAHCGGIEQSNDGLDLDSGTTLQCGCGGSTVVLLCTPEAYQRLAAVPPSGPRTERMDLHDELDRRYPLIEDFRMFVDTSAAAHAAQGVKDG